MPTGGVRRRRSCLSSAPAATALCTERTEPPFRTAGPAGSTAVGSVLVACRQHRIRSLFSPRPLWCNLIKNRRFLTNCLTTTKIFGLACRKPRTIRSPRSRSGRQSEGAIAEATVPGSFFVKSFEQGVLVFRRSRLGRQELVIANVRARAGDRRTRALRALVPKSRPGYLGIRHPEQGVVDARIDPDRPGVIWIADVRVKLLRPPRLSGVRVLRAVTCRVSKPDAWCWPWPSWGLPATAKGRHAAVPRG